MHIQQSCFPRIVKDTLQPLPQGAFNASTNADDWYPPGEHTQARAHACMHACMEVERWDD